MTNEFKVVIGALTDLGEEYALSRNMQAKIRAIVDMLGNGEEKSIKVNRALCALEVMTESVNLESDTRMRLFNVASMLEGM